MKLTPKLVLGVLTSIGLYLFNFNPSVIEGKDLYLIEYLMANFKHTIYQIITFALVLILMSSMESYKKLEEKIKEAVIKRDLLVNYARNHTLFSMLILVLITIIAFHSAVLFRNLYNFWNDSFAFSFRRSIYTRASVDHQVGNIFKAKEQFVKFKESYKGSYTADSYAKERIDDLQTLIDIKGGFITYADTHKETYKFTIYSFHKYADALRLNPFDYELRNKVIEYLSEYNNISSSLIKAQKHCRKQINIDPVDISRCIVALGFEKKSEFQLAESKESALQSQLCFVLEAYEEGELDRLSRQIWMIDDVKKLVDSSDPENLRKQKNEFISKITNKEMRIKYRDDSVSLEDQVKTEKDDYKEGGYYEIILREEPTFEK